MARALETFRPRAIPDLSSSPATVTARNHVIHICPSKPEQLAHVHEHVYQINTYTSDNAFYTITNAPVHCPSCCECVAGKVADRQCIIASTVYISHTCDSSWHSRSGYQHLPGWQAGLPAYQTGPNLHGYLLICNARRCNMSHFRQHDLSACLDSLPNPSMPPQRQPIQHLQLPYDLHSS